MCEKERENHKELEGYKKLRQGWEREKVRKRGMVGERKIGRQRRRRRDRGETKIERGGGFNPIFAHGKICVFSFFFMGKNGEKVYGKRGK